VAAAAQTLGQSMAWQERTTVEAIADLDGAPVAGGQEG